MDDLLTGFLYGAGGMLGAMSVLAAAVLLVGLVYDRW